MLGAVLAGFGCSPNLPHPSSEGSATTNGSALAPSADIHEGSAELRRIVTLSGHVTETVFALGLGEAVIAVDASSRFPVAATERAQLGYHRRLSAEGVLGLNPTLVLGNVADGPDSAVASIEGAGIPYSRFAEIVTIDDARSSIRSIAARVGRAERGDALVEAIDAELSSVQAALGDVTARPRVVFVYARGQGTLLVAGRNTAPSTLIEAAGGSNAIEFEEFRPLTPEAMLAAQPEVLLIPSEGLASLGGVEGLLAQPGVAQTPAGESGRVVAIDDSLLLTFGPRTGEAVRAVATALHPVLFGAQ
jgi:iron complex transport system substrate-binding protein